MHHDILTLGDKIDIRPLDRYGQPLHGSKTLVSQLVDLVDYNVIHIAVPIFYGKPILLKIGEKYNLCFYTGRGLYQCDCIVLSHHKENNTIISVVRISSNLEKVQRRQYYRLECIHEIEYRLITTEEEMLDRKLKLEDFRNPDELMECKKRLSQLDREWIKGSIIDLSGGGARFTSEVLHNIGDKVRLKLDIVIGSALKKMVLGAHIITSGRVVNRTGVYEHRIEFNDIMKNDREELIKYIFEQDRRRRRNEKL